MTTIGDFFPAQNGDSRPTLTIDFADGSISRWAFDMDYSGYVIEHFPEFEKEHPRLSRRFADTIDRTYSTCSWMTDDAFQYAISDALDLFLGTAPEADIY